MIAAANLGFPRLGAQRELKRALERFWLGKTNADALLETGRTLRQAHWQLQRAAGLDRIPSNDFSFYDHVLDTTAMVGAVPTRYRWAGGSVDLHTYFAMARGGTLDHAGNGGHSVTAMEMTKWFDTNYHYIVPEFVQGQEFSLASTKPIAEYLEAKALGIQTRPVLLGPISFLALGKSYTEGFDRFEHLPALIPVYAEVLQRLAAAGATDVQIDEPVLTLDLEERVRSLYPDAYAQLAEASPLRILLATYFGDLHENLDLALRLPVAGLHVDLVRGPEQLERILAQRPAQMRLSLGLISGENIWRADLDAALATIRRALAVVDARQLEIAPSTSLIYCPHDLALETGLDDELKSWLAFSKQKLAELVVLREAINAGEELVAVELAEARAALATRRTSPRTHNPHVQQRSHAVTQAMTQRRSSFPVRRAQQQAALRLPLLPTTTIGSFPQTDEVRRARQSFLNGNQDESTYRAFLEGEIERTIRIQEEIGLDVLVHGEFERTDMVEHFGQRLSGFAFTANGWVQSYGSRAVRPPILYGDVERLEPMTVAWAVYAQSRTELPVKGMLTGPVTILNWSFVRDDQPPAESCRQIALAIRDEVLDLEAAGIRVIQVDEPALREGLPLRRSEWDAYLAWAVECFRLAVAGVHDETQIHTHMCYAEFNDILDAIQAMDADVLSIESSRSQMELLDGFGAQTYRNEIGPGVYDIHSPRVPSVDEMARLLHKALQVIRPELLWVNPDCGLKTRRWEEVIPALRAMVAAAQQVRHEQVQSKEAVHG